MGRDPQLFLGAGSVRGESSIARLLARCFPDVFPYDDDASYLRADAWMDRACADLLHSGRSSDTARKFVSDLDAALSKSQSKDVAGLGRLGVADYVVWSALLKSGAAIGHGAMAVRKWNASCQAASGGRVNASRARGASSSGRGGGGGGSRVRRRSSRKQSHRESFSGSRPRGGRGPRRKSSGGGGRKSPGSNLVNGGGGHHESSPEAGVTFAN